MEFLAERHYKLKQESSSSNLKKHLKRHHPDQYKSLELKDSKLNENLNCFISQLVKKKSRPIFLK